MGFGADWFAGAEAPPSDQAPPAAPSSAPDTAPSVMTPTQTTPGFGARYFAETPQDQQRSGLVANIAAATNERVLHAAGVVPDIAQWAVNKGIWGVNSLLGTQQPYLEGTPLTSQWWLDWAQRSGEGPQDVVARTEGEKLARAGAGAATDVLLTAMGARAVPAVPGVAPEVAATRPVRGINVEPLATAGLRPSGAVAGFAGGVTGEAGREWFEGTPYERWAEMGGNVLGGGLAGGLAGPLVDATAGRLGLVDATGDAVEGAVQQYAAEHSKQLELDPDVKLTRKAVVGAGQRLIEAAKTPKSFTLDPDVGQPMVFHDPETGEPTFGYQPTLGQQTDNLGLLALERELRTRYNDLFIKHDSANNAAVAHALQSLAPEHAANAVGPWVRSQLDALRVSEEAEQALLTGRAQQATEALGGGQAGISQASLGDAARTRLEGMRQQVASHAKQALEGIDPENKMALPTDTVAASAKGLLGTEGVPASKIAYTPRLGEPETADVPVLKAAANMPAVSSFSDLRRLLGQVARAQRDLRISGAGVESEPYARLRELRQSIEDAMTHGAERSAAYNARNPAGAAPPPPPPTTPEDALRAQWGMAPEKPTEPPPPPPLRPNFEQQAADDFAKANQAYADYKQTWRRGPVGEVLASGNNVKGYRVGDADVVNRLFPSGAQGTEAVDALIRAAGSVKDAERVLGDYPAFALRQMAYKDGVPDYNKFIAALQKFKTDFGPAMARLSPEWNQKFDDWGRAWQEVKAATTRQVQTREAIEDSALKHYLKLDPDTDPREAINGLMKSTDPVGQARSLMSKVAADPDLLAGARRNAVDWVRGQIENPSESGLTGTRELSRSALTRLLEGKDKQSAALRMILGPERYAVLDKMSDALDIGARATQATKVPGSPGTARDLHVLSQRVPLSNILTAFMYDNLGDLAQQGLKTLGIDLPEPLMRLAALQAGRLKQQAEAMGAENINKLATYGVLNPGLGKELIKAATAQPSRSDIIKRQLALIYSGEQSRSRDRARYDEGQARGGRVPVMRSMPAGAFWRGGAIIPQPVPPRFH